MNELMKTLKLDVPTDFEFPFTPYTIQEDFMKKLYEALEERKLGIFESPTGTGKSLSIICGALKWLRDHESREREEYDLSMNHLKQEKESISKTNEDWLVSQPKEIEITKKMQSVQIELKKLKDNDEKIKKLKSKKKDLNVTKKYNVDNKKKSTVEKSDEIVDDYDLILEDVVDDNEELDETDDNESKYEGLKIYICSRTHSQLAQLVHEVERSPFGNDIRLVSLASRQNYCINPNVNKFNNATLINEKCLELQKSKSKSTAADTEGKTVKKKKTNCNCPYMQSKLIEELSEIALTQVQDVEQLVTVGKKTNACPYYAARNAVKDAQVVILPYNLILHKSTREATGITLKNNVIIIDEAHNLLEAITDMHSAHVSGHQLMYAHNQLTEYRNKYRSRFNASNLLNLNQIIYIVGQFVKVLGGKPGSITKENIKDPVTKLVTLPEFVTLADVDNYNIYPLLQFCRNSRLAQKLNGFAMKYQSTVTIHTKAPEKGISAFLKELSKTKEEESVVNVENNVASEDIPKNPMLSVLAFLDALTNKCNDGRIVYSKQTAVSKGFLKFLLLNPSSCFKEIVSEARSVIVTGGTMQPISEFKDRLFISAGAIPDRISEFSCDHIVPRENIMPIALMGGPTGQRLDFTYGSRNDSNTICELGRILQNVCNVVPGGIVCFFPSYDYEKLVYSHLERTKTLNQISMKKQVFREPKLSSDVDKILSQYSRAIKFCVEGKTGSILFSVVGGKLSEGLNFSDDLGRCVIVVGMPYPNIKSPELVEKMAYLNKTEGISAGNIYYENLCMKAVNQCIGRAVRHQNDYACVLLLDERYSRLKTQKALPAWILKSFITHEKFGAAISGISKFFLQKKKS